MTAVPKLAGLAEVAALVSASRGRPVSRTRAGQIAAHPGFPAPVARLAMGPVWVEADVKKFLATPRKAGKPKS